MFYGVEFSTDMRDRRCVIKKFSSENGLQKWLHGTGKSGRMTYDNPEEARNYHHTFRQGYELVGRVNKKDPIWKQQGTRTYPMDDNQRMHNYLHVYGRAVY